MGRDCTWTHTPRCGPWTHVKSSVTRKPVVQRIKFKAAPLQIVRIQHAHFAKAHPQLTSISEQRRPVCTSIQVLTLTAVRLPQGQEVELSFTIVRNRHSDQNTLNRNDGSQSHSYLRLSVLRLSIDFGGCFEPSSAASIVVYWAILNTTLRFIGEGTV